MGTILIKELLVMNDMIYLDNASTTPIHKDVVAAMMECLTEEFGNPSSLHRLGFNAEMIIKGTREVIADFLSAETNEIVFTSGGTEANNLAVLGAAMAKRKEGRHIITTSIEHPSVLSTFVYLQQEGWEVTFLPVNKDGVIDIADLANAIRPDTVLISVMHVNNELGSIQPIQEIGAMLKNRVNRPLFHVDGVQSFGKIPVYPGQVGIDLLSFSGHKINGPKGVGGLYIRQGVRLQPMQWGGGQERGLRSGTENMPGIAGLGKAVEIVNEYIKNEPDKLYNLKLDLAKGITEKIPGAVINGPRPEDGAPHILNVSFKGIRGEVLLHALESKGVFVSTGSACSSHKNTISHVLDAIGLDKDRAKSAIRFSLSYMNSKDEIEKVPDIIKETVEELRPFARR